MSEYFFSMQGNSPVIGLNKAARGGFHSDGVLCGMKTHTFALVMGSSFQELTIKNL
jgi:hypothetical protein